MVFGDAALWAMVAAKPRDRDQMLAVNGVGAEKLRRYGDGFLAVIARWRIEMGD